MNELFTDQRRASTRRLAHSPCRRWNRDIASLLEVRFSMTGRDIGGALGPLDATAGHPQRTMLLAHAVWNATPAGGSAEEAILSCAHGHALADLTDEFRAQWTGLPASHDAC
jgi:hypothetical protein